MSFLNNPTSKLIDFLDRYAERTVSSGCDYYHLKLGGIRFDYTLHVDGDDHWITGSKEDIKFLKKLFKKKVEES